ncbi:unnamed protein product [Closterium sp. Yama58-4]|nr:unnamed protein product [Closterium sp. Yama58-4]
MSPSPSLASSPSHAACEAPRKSSHTAFEAARKSSHAAAAAAPSSLIRLVVVAAALLLLFATGEAQPTPSQQPSPIRPPLSSSPPSSSSFSSPPSFSPSSSSSPSSPSTSPPSSSSTFSPFQPLLLGGLQANLTPILLPTSTSPIPTTTTLTPTTPTSTALNLTTNTLTPGSAAGGATPSTLGNASALPGGGASVVTLLVNAANGTLGFALPWAQGAGENVQAGIYTVGDMLNAPVICPTPSCHLLYPFLSPPPPSPTIHSLAPPYSRIVSSSPSSPRLVLPLMRITANSSRHGFVHHPFPLPCPALPFPTQHRPLVSSFPSWASLPTHLLTPSLSPFLCPPPPHSIVSSSRPSPHGHHCQLLTSRLLPPPFSPALSCAPLPHTASSPRLVLPLMGITANSTPPAAAASATRATSASSSSSPLDPLTAAAAGVAGALGGLGTSAAGVTAGPGVTAGSGVTAEPGVSSGGMAGSGGASGATAGPRAATGATGTAGATGAAGAGEGLGAAAASTAPVTQGPRRGLSGSVVNPVAAAAGAAQGAVGAAQGVVRSGSGWLWGAVPVPGAALVNILRNPSQYQLRLSVGNGADAASFAGRLVAVPIDLARSIPFLGSLIPEPPRFPSQPSLGIPTPQSLLSAIPNPQALLSLATAIRESIAALPQTASARSNPLVDQRSGSSISAIARKAEYAVVNFTFRIEIQLLDLRTMATPAQAPHLATTDSGSAINSPANASTLGIPAGSSPSTTTAFSPLTFVAAVGVCILVTAVISVLVYILRRMKCHEPIGGDLPSPRRPHRVWVRIGGGNSSSTKSVGLDASLIRSFPVMIFSSEKAEFSVAALTEKLVSLQSQDLHADQCAANSATNPAPGHVVVTLDEENACLRECAVCLGDYDEGERIKLLPPCGHRFHADCIDLWLSSKSTCPICRKDLRPASVTCEKGYAEHPPGLVGGFGVTRGS